MSQQLVFCPYCHSRCLVPPTVAAGFISCPQCRASVPVSPQSASRQPSSGLLIGILVAVLGGGTLLAGVMVAVLASFWLRSAPEGPAVAAAAAEAQPAAGPAPAARAEGAPDGVQSLALAESDLETDAETGSDDVPLLRYGWTKDKRYSYRFEVQADLGEVKDGVNGSLSYAISHREPKIGTPGRPAREEGSGSAFVISTDGYLVTCAHVVRGASKIEVVLGGKTYPAQVVGESRAHDLALLRIEAQGLAYLALGDSDQVQLAEEVHVVGFPLSDVLGQSGKITRGTVAGLLARQGRKLLQVDAGINPGNSGGPIVNDRGEVIAVASAKLTGEEISNVGFGVPASEVKSLLKRHRVALPPSTAGSQLRGPELARRVMPGVALVRVTSGPSSAGNLFALSYYGYLYPLNRDRDLSDPYSYVLPRDERDEGELVVDAEGNVLSDTSQRQLPYLQGALSQFVLIPLPAEGETQWQTQRTVSMTRSVEERPEPGYPFGPRPRRPFSPFGRQPATTTVVTMALEQVDYELGEREGDLIVIRRHYELKSLGGPGEPAASEMVGDGEIRFNLALGVPEKMEFSGTLSQTAGPVTLRVPVKLSYERFEVQQTPATPAATTPSGSEAPATAATPAPAVQSPSEKLTLLLADLQSPEDNFSLRYVALNGLAQMQPIEERREEVLKAVEPFLTDSNISLKGSAVRAFAAWANEKNVPKLLTLIDESQTFDSSQVMTALARTKDPRAAEALAGLVASQRLRFYAAQALEQMGEAAEDHTIPLLDHADRMVRYQVCAILGRAGGEKSIAALKALLEKEKDGFVRAGAESALQQVESRVGRPAN